MKVRLAHTHPNPRYGKQKNEPLFIVVAGPKELCRECRQAGTNIKVYAGDVRNSKGGLK